jgi:hypothetical protein
VARGPEWSVVDLVARVDRALDMAARAIDLVISQPAGVDLVALEAPPDKIIAETAMLLRAIAASPSSGASALVTRAHGLARALLPHARSPRVLSGLLLHPALARDYAAAHVVLGVMGYPDAAFDRALATAMTATTAQARERLPHRELEQEWLAALTGGPVPSHAAVDRTALVRGVDLLTGTRDDVYALTHALLYATDFGLRPLTDELEVLAVASSALAGALDDDDFDLAAELLLAWPCIGAGFGPVPSFAFAVLAGVEDDVGVLPSLALGPDTVAGRPPESRTHSVTAATYHTAFVMGLLCASLLRAAHRPGLRIDPTSVTHQTFAGLLVDSLDAQGRQPQWLRRLRATSNDTQGACVALALDVALRRAVRRLDLAALRKLLQQAVINGVGATALSGQAASLLRRIAAHASEFDLLPVDSS